MMRMLPKNVAKDAGMYTKCALMSAETSTTQPAKAFRTESLAVSHTSLSKRDEQLACQRMGISKQHPRPLATIMEEKIETTGIMGCYLGKYRGQ